MPPHGRRRCSTLTSLFLFFSLFASAALAAQAVLGIDIGTEYIKAALVKPGVPLDIVLTKDSKRKETAALAFKSIKTKVNTAEDEDFPERVYGSDAVALSARFPGDVFPNIKSLLGLNAKDDIVTEYSSWRPELQLVEFEDTGKVGFKSENFVKDEAPFLVEELLAMELKNVKTNAQMMAGKGYAIQDVVITVPSFYTVEERRAITIAAELAGLRVLSLISDGLAVGLNYATSRTFPVVNDGGKPEIHLIYDMGAGSTTATVLKFQGRTVKDVGKYNKTIQEVLVLSTGWDRTLGGDALNGLIVDDMIQKMAETPVLKRAETTVQQIKSHGRTMSKLWKEAERIRQVLSANTETQSSMESLYNDDLNFKYKLKRSDFERMCGTFAERVNDPIEKALSTAKLSFADLDSVILHGGTVRTPFVQKKLEGLVKSTEKIRTNVNSDEAAVFGAAFKAATISPSFRVKEIRVSDNAGYPVSMSWSIDGKDKQQKLFIPTSQVGAEKQVSIKTIEDFSFQLFQQVPQPQADLYVSSITTQNLTDSVKQLTKLGCEASDISTRFGIRISPVDGLPEVVGCTVSCEVVETKKSGGVVEGMKDFLGFGSKKDAQEPLKDDLELESSEASSETSSSTSESETPTTSSAESTTTLSASTSSDTTKAPRKKTEIVSIAFRAELAGSPKIKKESLTRIQTRLTAFDASDRFRVLREEALNNLEGYTYKIRDILEDQGFVNVSTSAQREEIEAKSDEASTWLYGDGADANQATLKARLDELRSLVNPIIKRKEEQFKRPNEIQKLQEALMQTTSMVELIKNQIAAELASESEKSASMSSSLEAESSNASSSSAQTTESPTTSSDDFTDLDEEPFTSSTTSSTSTSTQEPSSTPFVPTYSQEDLAALAEREAATKAWLDEKLALQEKLGPTDDPAVLSTELAAKTKELNDATMEIVMRQVKPIKGSSSSSSKKAKTKKSAKAKPSAMTIDVNKAASSSASSSATASTSVSASPSSTTEEDDSKYYGSYGSVPNGAKDPFEEFADMEGVSKEDIEAALKAEGLSPEDLADGESDETAAKASKASADDGGSSSSSSSKKGKKKSTKAAKGTGKAKSKTKAKSKSKKAKTTGSDSSSKASGKKKESSSSSSTAKVGTEGHGEL